MFFLATWVLLKYIKYYNAGHYAGIGVSHSRKNKGKTNKKYIFFGFLFHPYYPL